jgi:hypothetical protein
MQSHYTYQDTNISQKIRFKNIRRSSPTRDQNWPLETQVEETTHDANLAEGFAFLTTTHNKLNLINMPSPPKDYEHMKMLQTMSDSLREQQFQAILELGVELQDILQEIKKLHNAYPLPEGDLATPVKSVANTPDCIIDTPRKHDGPALQNTRIPQNPHKIRKKKKKQILPQCPTQTLEPERTYQTQKLQNVYSLPDEGDLATPVKSAANPMTGRK